MRCAYYNEHDPQAAARRGVTAERLARDILNAVIADDLIGADTPSPTEGDKR